MNSRRNIFLILLCCLFTTVVTGCFTAPETEDQNTNEKPMFSNEVIEVHSPKLTEMISSLEFQLSGNILKDNMPYFFYQVEDGHHVVSEGLVEVNEDLTFSVNIAITSPTNAAGAIIFYSDLDNDKVFNIEENVNEQFGQMAIEFASDIQVPLDAE